MAKTTIPSSIAPRDTQTAAGEIGCSVSTLRNYVRDELIDPPRTPSGRWCWFDPQIERARKIFERNTQRA
jgi:predicted site-specific integrase-resolvase